MTVNAWLNLYLQLLNVDNLEDQEHCFIFPQYSAHAFIQIAKVSLLGYSYDQVEGRCINGIV
jgi:hypothetical protein